MSVQPTVNKFDRLQAKFATQVGAEGVGRFVWNLRVDFDLPADFLSLGYAMAIPLPVRDGVADRSCESRR